MLQRFLTTAPCTWLFQIADVDSGVIRWVNADLVTHAIPTC